MAEIDVLQAHHGNEQLGVRLHKMLTTSPLDNVRSRIAHPEAVRRRVRHIGKRQIMAHYPGDPSGDTEDIAAHANMAWLGEHVGDPDVIIGDVHDSKAQGFAEFGRRASLASVGAAIAMTMSRFLLYDGNFQRSVPNHLILENKVCSLEDQKNAATRLYAGLLAVSQMTPDELRMLCLDTLSTLQFFHFKEICIDTSWPDTEYCISVNAHTRQQLEDMPFEEPGSEINLSNELRRTLQLPLDRALYYGYWGYDNHSDIVLGSGNYNGVVRRQAFCSIEYQMGTMVPQGKWLQYMPE